MVEEGPVKEKKEDEMFEEAGEPSSKVKQRGAG
jgi:hypothetical protein